MAFTSWDNPILQHYLVWCKLTANQAIAVAQRFQRKLWLIRIKKPIKYPLVAGKKIPNCVGLDITKFEEGLCLFEVLQCYRRGLKVGQRKFPGI
jgi:hypothetical protein